MLFSKLAEEYLDEDIKPYVDKLLKIKAEAPEITMGDRIDPINLYLEKNMEEISAAAEKMPEEKTGSWQELNRLFLSIIKGQCP